MKTMNVAVDYDRTFTNDPEFWDEFIVNGMLRGHTFYIVTMRSPDEPIEQEPSIIEGIIYTDRKAKRPFCEDLGLNFDVWIDDKPQLVVEDYKEE